MSSPEAEKYGTKDTTFRAAGGENGIRQLVDHFYDVMSSESAYQRIFAWHPDADIARDKLARFLCGWMGGPRRYQEKYGAISIPKVHQHLAITEVERDLWLNCMEQALDLQNYPADLKKYLLIQLSVPADMIRRYCSEQH